MIKMSKYLFVMFCSIAFSTVFADVTVNIYLTAPKGNGKAIGTIMASDTKDGLLLTPNLTDLSPGSHGFHVHENPSCDDSGTAAGGHLDPNKTGKHQGPFSNSGHLGDLPSLTVDKEGKATTPVLAPRLKLQDILNHSLMIHAGGDNYSDNPAMGGGGARIACGVVK